MTDKVKFLKNYHIEQWQPIESAPKGKKILVFYKNLLVKNRIVTASYIEKHSEELLLEDYHECEDYCEARDMYFLKEGWYEESDNHPEYTIFPIVEGIPTHWMPLPKSPEDKK